MPPIEIPNKLEIKIEALVTNATLDDQEEYQTVRTTTALTQENQKEILEEDGIHLKRKAAQIITGEITSALADKQNKNTQATQPQSHKKQTTEAENKEKEETEEPNTTKEKGIYTTEKGRTRDTTNQQAAKVKFHEDIIAMVIGKRGSNTTEVEQKYDVVISISANAVTVYGERCEEASNALKELEDQMWRSKKNFEKQERGRELCPHQKQGYCRHGDTCPYKHSRDRSGSRNRNDTRNRKFKTIRD